GHCYETHHLLQVHRRDQGHRQVYRDQRRRQREFLAQNWHALCSEERYGGRKDPADPQGRDRRNYL
ncbi:hypothetical protein KXW34_007543, partial [Aspergillus fumigatus]